MFDYLRPFSSRFFFFRFCLGFSFFAVAVVRIHSPGFDVAFIFSSHAAGTLHIHLSICVVRESARIGIYVLFSLGRCSSYALSALSGFDSIISFGVWIGHFTGPESVLIVYREREKGPQFTGWSLARIRCLCFFAKTCGTGVLDCFFWAIFCWWCVASVTVLYSVWQRGEFPLCGKPYTHEGSFFLAHWFWSFGECL